MKVQREAKSGSRDQHHVHTFNNKWGRTIIELCEHSICDTILLTDVLPEVIDDALLHSMNHSHPLTCSQDSAQYEQENHQ